MALIVGTPADDFARMLARAPPNVRPTRKDGAVRIGTWNMAGRWSDQHQAFVTDLQCDVLLLTEVSDRVEIPAMAGHVTELLMQPRRHWAGIWSRHPINPRPDPHGASAAAAVEGIRFCSSILPWRSCGSQHPWVGVNTFERTVEAVDAIERDTPVVWGGDWNHALGGREFSGSMAGRRHIDAALGRMSLTAPTAEMPHQIDGLLSIDHIALPNTWQWRAEHHTARIDQGRLADHDAYVVEISGPFFPA